MTLEIFDSSGKKVQEHKKNYPIDLTEDELEGIIVKDYSIEIRIELAPGKYTFSAELINQADGNKAWRKGKFSV